MISIRQMDISEIDHIKNIDRTEYIKKAYLFKHGTLNEISVEWDVSPWNQNDDSNQRLNRFIKAVIENISSGGIMWGAFEGELLVGFVILNPKLTESMANLSFLYISNKYRRKGIGRNLTEIACEKAKELGHEYVYVSATPSKSTVDFYVDQGFQLAKEVNSKLFEKEPEDIHMVKQIHR